MTFKIPQGGHSVIAAVTVASLLLVGAAALTVVIETPLTQALAATPPATVVRVANAGETPERARLARCACNRWRRASNAASVQCAVDELVISQDWVVARLNLRPADLRSTPRTDVHAVEVMHLIDGHVDEDWPLASTHATR